MKHEFMVLLALLLHMKYPQDTILDYFRCFLLVEGKLKSLSPSTWTLAPNIFGLIMYGVDILKWKQICSMYVAILEYGQL